MAAFKGHVSNDEIVRLRNELATNQKVADVLGISEATVRRRLRAMGRDSSPAIPASHIPSEGLTDTISGDVRNMTSVSYEIRTVEELMAFAEIDPLEWVPDKVTVNRWGKPEAPMYQVKATLKRNEKYDQSQEMLEAFLERGAAIKPRKPSEMPKGAFDEDLLTKVTITDAHIGMLAWHEENRDADWDLKIAKETVIGCLTDGMTRSQNMAKAGTCILNFMGDFSHYDSMESVTPANRHLLDADGRPAKMVKAANDVMIGLVDIALSLYKHVIVWILEGNHDPMTTVMSRDWMRRLYAKEGRVTVCDDPAPYYAMQWGSTLIGSTHGHLKAGKALGEVYSQRFRDMMSTTKKTFVHTGHRHSTKSEETNTTVIEQHPTLAAADAYASRHGYDSLRRAACITYHVRHFEHHRTWATIEPRGME